MSNEKSMLIDQLIQKKVAKLISIRARNMTVSNIRNMIKDSNNKDFKEVLELDDRIKKLTQK